MRVPTKIVPQTSPAAEVRGPLRAVPTDYSPLVSAAGELAKQVRTNQLNRETFDLNKRFMEETNALRSDFETRVKTADLGAPNFAESLQSDYTTRHQALVEEYKTQGYDQESINDFQLRLGTLRGSMFGQALGFQAKNVEVKARSDATANATQISQYTTANPGAVQAGLDELRQNLNLLAGTVDAMTLEDIYQRESKVIINGAAQGLAIQDPEGVVRTLAPQLLQVPGARGGAGPSANPWGNVAVTVANELGLNPVELAAIMSFETGGTFDPTITNASGHMGLIQFGKNEQATYGITPSSTPEQWAIAITRFFKDRGLKPGADIMDVYSTILTGSPGNYDRADSNGTTVRNAVPRILADHLAKADAWLGPREQTPTPASMPAASGVKVNHPVLGLLDGPEQMSVLSAARSELNRRDSQIQAEVGVKVENAVSAYQHDGAYSGPPISDEELVRAYGPVKAAQVRGVLQANAAAGSFVQGIKTQSGPSIQAGLEALRPRAGSPTYDKEAEAYDAAQRAVKADQEAREADPAAYVFRGFPNITEQLRTAKDSGSRRAAFAAMNNAYNQLGIPEDQRFPLPKDAIAQTAQEYLNAPPQQRLNNLSQWFQEIPQGGMLRSFIHQMREATNGKISGGLGRDAFLYATLAGHPEFRNVMLDAMAGSDVIASDPARTPQTNILEREFVRKFPGGIELNGAASADYQKIAMALYVNAGGRTENNALTNPEAYDTAVRRAFGGRSDDPNTGLVTHNGSSLILPPAITKPQFETWLTGRTLQDLVNSSVGGRPPLTKFNKQPQMEDIIDDGQFVMKAPGVYAVKFRNQPGYLVDRTGQPFLVRITPQTVRGR